MNGKAPRLHFACPIDGIAMEASGAGTEGARGRMVGEEARQVTDGMVTKQLGPGA